MDRGDEAVLAAEGANEFNAGAERAKRRDRQHVGIVEVEHALVGIFGKQGIEHGARLPAVFGEHVALLDVLGPLAPGQRLLVESDMADEVKGIEVLAQFLGDRIERQALGFQFLDDRLLAVRRLPAFEEILEAGEALLQRLLGEIPQGFCDELAILVEIFDAFGMMVAPTPST